MKVIHVMSNGERRDSIEGMVVPTTNTAYQTIAHEVSRANEEARRAAQEKKS